MDNNCVAMAEIKATNDQKSTIIDLVQAEPCLWNMRDDVYHQMRNIAKNRIWARIATAVHLDMKVTKATWTSLRTQFKRELKNCGEKHSGDSGGDTDLYFGTWHFFHHLLFLRDTVMPRPTQSNLDMPNRTSRVSSTPLASKTVSVHQLSMSPLELNNLHDETSREVPIEEVIPDNDEDANDYAEALVEEDEMFEENLITSPMPTNRSSTSSNTASSTKKRKPKAQEIELSLERKKVGLYNSL